MKPNTPSPMLEHLPSYLLLSTTAITMALASREWLLVAPILVMISLHPALYPKINFKLGFFGGLLLTLPFAFLSRVWEVEGQRGFGFNEPFYISLYLMTYSILRMFGGADKAHEPRLLAMTAIPMTFAGMELDRFPYVLLTIVYGLDMLVLLRKFVNARAPRKKASARQHLQAVILSVVLLVACTLGMVFLIDTTYPKLDRFFLHMMYRGQRAQAAGFSREAELTSISDLRNSEAEQEVMIRAYGKRSPQYLRGKVFMVYGKGRWSTLTSGRDQTLKKDLERNDEQRRFVLPGRPAPAAQSQSDLTIIPASLYGAHYFLPLEAAAFDTPGEEVVVFPGNTINSKYTSTANGYDVFLSPQPVLREVTEGDSPTGVQISIGAYLAIPPNPSMRDALSSIFRINPPKNNTREAVVEAIQDYFITHYTYKIGIKFHEGVDPLYQFLTAKRHGHCELFASAGTLLLRMKGIPARYVTGFVCDEKSPYGDIWYARRKHAHAWVEYFTPENGWQIAEFTPPDGQPDTSVQSDKWPFWDYIKAQWNRLLGRLKRLGMGGVLTLFFEKLAEGGWWIIGSWWRATLLAAFMGWFFYNRWWRRKNARAASLHQREYPADIAELRDAFFTQQRQLRRFGLSKVEAETLAEYIHRLNTVPFPTGENAPDKKEIIAFLAHFEEKRYAPFGENNTTE